MPARLPPVWILVAAVVIATFYPGIMTNDSLSSLKQARAFEFSDWHPPIMAIIWAGLDRIVQGPALMLAAQAILYAVACARVCVEAFPALVKRFTPWVVVPVFALFPPVMVLNGMIWKDVWMSGFLLLALGYLFRMANASRPRTRWTSLAVVVVSCLLATAFRHNALAATAGLLAGACYYTWRHDRRLVRLAVACFAGVGAAFLLYALVSAGNRMVATPANVTTPILLHDIAGIIQKSGEPETAAAHALSISPGLTNSNLKTFLRRVEYTYSPASAGRVMATRRKPNAPFNVNAYDPNHDAGAVKDAWKAMVKRYPGSYLRHRSHAFACLMQLCGRDQWAYHSYILNPRYALPAESPAWQLKIRRPFTTAKITLLFLPAFWLATSLALCGAITIAAWTKPAESELAYGFVLLSALGLATSLLFSSPIESYRYVHWIIVCGWLCVFHAVDRGLIRIDSKNYV
jgi:hypothetical protein